MYWVFEFMSHKKNTNLFRKNSLTANQISYHFFEFFLLIPLDNFFIYY